ncbi:hypothetical protein Afil01_03130 [Actinorhabdospora filicis]|uniref:Carrier domain-containing protein n=1 Tax=Actinorhabdospora filicis TaxID=1785913 RepID=A0A9W6SIX9_9ACTN|nr:non-ribosomal peptide synthetase [Actinorhabdospora filicis]GLZ75506.1 hypothetical protein Afil01_03130 [Actinorhabdospora filicis]
MYPTELMPRIAAIAGARPDAPAVRGEAGTVTYGRLRADAGRLARRLAARGAGPGTVVAVCLPRGAGLVTALLGVLEAGAAYLPLDPGQPPARLRHMLDAAGAGLVLATGHAGLFEEAMDPEGDGPLAEPAAAHPEDLAYIVYTSGSTGEPKPVAVTRRSLDALATAAGARYGLSERDTVLQFANPAFDVLAEEVFASLAAGAAIVPAPDEGITPRALEGLIARHGVTVANLPTPYWTAWTRDLRAAPSSLRLLVVGSEAGRADTLAAWQAVTAIPVINAYGLSETTVTATAANLPPAAELDAPVLPVGEPLRGCVTRVLDAELAAAEEGELYIGGALLARGYHGRPALTAERFVPDPFGSGERLYRTGDLVRRGPHGLEFLGRADGQVKIRGHRVEPMEVAAALAAHPDLADAHVTARDGDLIGYAVPRDARAVPTPAALREHLATRLPAYMVPSAYVVLDVLPLGRNGKVDAAALPAPARRSAPAAEPPATPAEEALCRIWREVLELDALGATDDLREFGAHSLTAVRVAAAIETELGATVTLREVFAAATVRELAALAAARASGPAEDGFEPEDGPGPPPLHDELSLQQEQVWFLNRLAPDSIAYHTPTTIRVRGPLDLDVLDRVVTEIARRHEILRTTFAETGGRPAQTPHPPGPVTARRADLRHLPPGEREARFEELFAAELRRPFDLGALPLIRWTAVRLGEDEWELILVEHHLVHDGWSFAMLMRDLRELYTAYREGRESPLPEPRSSYRDHARRQRRDLDAGRMDDALARWRERLAGLPAPVAPPADRPRGGVAAYTGGMLRIELPPTLPGALRETSRRLGVSLFTTMYAGFAALLHRYTGEGDIAIGSAFANRRPPATHDVLGMFVNPVVLRCPVTPEEPFAALAARAAETVLSAADDEAVPFPLIVREVNPGRDPAANPLVAVMFSANDSPLPALDLGGGVTGTVHERGNGGAKTDMNVVVVPRAESQRDGDDRILLMWEYDAALYDEDTVRAIADAYLRLLTDAAAHPERAVAALDLLGGTRREILAAGRGAHVPGGPAAHLAVAARAAATPAAVAIAEPGRAIDYATLTGDAARLAGVLAAHGAGPGEIVAVCLPSGAAQVTAALAVLHTGAAYLALDPANPPERLSWMCRDAGARLAIADTARPDGVTVIDPGARGEPFAPRPVAPGETAYVIYTSGSTGRPKGVAVSHGALAGLIAWHRDAFALTPRDRATLLAGPGFDAAVWETWPALATGAALHVPDHASRVSATAVRAWLAEHEITIAFAPTPLAEAMLALPPVEGPLRILLTGGDRLHLRPPADLPYTLVNNYGPTEATVVTTTGTVGDGTGLPAIGRPRAGLDAHVLDPELAPVPDGAVGELHIGGPALARGYLGRAALTAERFVPDPFGTGTRLYRTGDLVRRRGGVLEFLGRADGQVKIRGHRVELGEITAALLAHPGVTDAHTAVRPDPRTGEPALVAYLTGEKAPGRDELREHLRGWLPGHMIPGAHVVLDAIPVTANGKVDAAALPDPQAAPEPPATVIGGGTEAVIAGIWRRVLGHDRFGARDNFFDVGGHSLLLGRVHHLLTTETGRDVPVVDLFRFPTVAALAGHLERPAEAADGPVPTRRRPARARALRREIGEHA